MPLPKKLYNLPGQSFTEVLLDNIYTEPTAEEDQRLERPVSLAIEDSKALKGKRVHQLPKEDLIKLVGVLMNECSIYSQSSLWDLLDQRREAQEDRLEEFDVDSSGPY